MNSLRLFIVSAVLVPTALASQTVRGTVLDSATARPLSGVTAELLDSVDNVVSQATGNDSGSFVVAAKVPGEYRLQLRRIGYRTALSGELALGQGGEMTVSVRLPARPVELAPVNVEATRNEFLAGRGYYQRKESERGTFLDPALVEKKAVKAKVSTDILIGIPGVSVTQNVPRLRGCGPDIPSDRTGGPRKAAPLRQPKGAIIYIDGVEAGTDMMWSLQPNDILAVEVYVGPAQIPLQYGGTSTPCGVLLIWTKH